MRRSVYIIAEAGVNHNGSLAIARKLVYAAKKAGADAVKFQTFKSELLASPKAKKAAYQVKTTGHPGSQLQMLKRLELSEEAHLSLKAYCRRLGIDFLSSPFDVPSLDFLLKLGLRTIKIPSGEITNLPLLRRAGGAGRKIIISSGMATLQEIDAAIKALYLAGTKRADVTLLHCTTEYPAPMKEVNLNAMVNMGNRFNLRYGYSDHTSGITIPIAAAALGAEVIEKHLTLDNRMPGPDHKASLEPGDFARMVDAVRDVGQALGNGVKSPTSSERRNVIAARKSIVAAVPIVKGEAFTAQNITTMRPGGGISPMSWDKVLGRRAARAFAPGEKIQP